MERRICTVHRGFLRPDRAFDSMPGEDDASWCTPWGPTPHRPGAEKSSQAAAVQAFGTTCPQLVSLSMLVVLGCGLDEHPCVLALRVWEVLPHLSARAGGAP